MADDVTVDNGSGTDYTVATDDVGGKQYQRVKLDVGGDGASVPVEGKVPVGGDVAHNTADSGNPVKIAGVYRAIPDIVDDGDRSDLLTDDIGRLRVRSNGEDYIVGGASGENAEVTGSGDTAALNVGGNVAHDAADSGKPVSIGGRAHSSAPAAVSNADRVNAYFDTVGRLAVQDGGGSLTVDGTVTVNALPAGTANIGDVDVASIAAGDNNIGNVDIVTVPSPLSTAGNGTAAAAHRVTIASDSTGVIGVTDNGGSLTVDGTVAVTNAALTELAGAIDTEMQVDVVAALPAGDNNIGNVDVVTMPTVAVTGTFWQATQPVSLAATVTTKQRADTATLSNVASSASSVTILAANTSRLGCSIQNDSTQVLYLKFGTTASTSSYTVKMAADAHYEVPFGYTGRIDGIWASANGNARITELT